MSMHVHLFILSLRHDDHHPTTLPRAHVQHISHWRPRLGESHVKATDKLVSYVSLGSRIRK